MAARTKHKRAQYKTSFGQRGVHSLPLRPMIEQLSTFTSRRLRAARRGARHGQAPL